MDTSWKQRNCDSHKGSAVISEAVKEREERGEEVMVSYMGEWEMEVYEGRSENGKVWGEREGKESKEKGNEVF